MKMAMCKKILVYCWIHFQFVKLQSFFVFAFSSNKCDHDEIENSIKATLNCSLWCLNENIENTYIQMNTTRYFDSNSTILTPKSTSFNILNVIMLLPYQISIFKLICISLKKLWNLRG